MKESLRYIYHYEPAQDTTQAVTLLLLHGTGGNENDLAGLGRMLLPGAGQLRPRGNVLENGQARYFRRFAEGVLDIEDVKRRTAELAIFVQQASEVYGFDQQQIIAAGFSNGANITASMLFLLPQTLQAAILLHPMVPFVPETLPELKGKPVFIGAGRADPLVPAAQTEKLAELLQQAGAQIHIFWHNGGHSISKDEVKAAKSWLETTERMSMGK
jgi:phospholipase/carboxylesterase